MNEQKIHELAAREINTNGVAKLFQIGVRAADALIKQKDEQLEWAQSVIDGFKESQERQAEEVGRLRAENERLRELEALLYDGYTVLKNLPTDAKGRTRSVHVSDTLDGLKSAWKENTNAN